MLLLKSPDRPQFETYWTLKNEIKPVDLYCYSYARFGPPNGIQNFLRANHSENLFHWEWALQSRGRILLVQGMNFRTEIWLSGEKLPSPSRDELVASLKSTFADYSPGMSRIRKSLEHWIEFVNPYQRIRRSVKKLVEELENLNVNEGLEKRKDLADYDSPEEWAAEWKRQADTYSRATGLCFGVRSMLPVMAEAFVNFLLYMLMKPVLKKDERLRENLIRQPIDVRIKSLAHNCIGFQRDVDYNSDICRRYHQLVSERNDLLHGNVIVEKLKFNELYFNRKAPVFESYSSMWDRAFGVAQRSVGLEILKRELATVEELIEYLLTCLDEKIRDQVRLFSEKHGLGMCLDDGRLGALFSGQLVAILLLPKVSK
ncbi:MAG: hypothetical protein ACRESZ_07190 [Methylococcales bacterium]